MARTRVRRRRTTLAAIALAIAASLLGPLAHAFEAGATARQVPSRTYVVRPGDTLWMIARSFRPSEDPRVVVDEIRTANGVSPGSIMPGMSLVVPLGA